MSTWIRHLGLAAAIAAVPGCDGVEERDPTSAPADAAEERPAEPTGGDEGAQSDAAPTLQVFVTGTNNESVDGAVLRVRAVALRDLDGAEPTDGCGCAAGACTDDTFPTNFDIALDHLDGTHEVLADELAGVGHYDELSLFVEAAVPNADGSGAPTTVGACSEVVVVFPEGRNFEGGTQTLIVLDLDGEASLRSTDGDLAFRPTIVSYLAMTRWTKD